MKVSKPLVVVLIFVIQCAVLVSGQATPDVEQGMKPYGSYHGGNLDNINLTNGNLFFHADLFSYSQRGGELAYPVSLQYNGKNFSMYQTPCAPGTSLNAGCTLQLTVLFGPNPLRTQKKSYGNSVKIGYDGLPGVGTSYLDTSLSFDGNEIIVQPSSAVMPDGSVHQLAPSGSGMVALDGSGYGVTAGGNFAGRDGTKYSSAGALAEDRNGNQITVSSTGNWVDTLGRTIPPVPTVPLQGTPNPSTASLGSCPALNYPFQSVTYAYTWNLPTVGSNNTLLLIVCYTSVFVRTNILGTPATGPNFFDVNQAFPMLQSVVFPDNTYWAFQYDAADPNNASSFAFGDLLKVTLPIGGSITYNWSGLGLPCDSGFDRAVQTRTVDANDGTGPHKWTYNYTGGLSTSGVTVTDPLGNDTVHTITGLGTELMSGGGPSCSLYETKTQYYQGSQSGGTLLKTVSTDYQYTINPYDPAVISSGGAQVNATTVTNVFPIRVTTSLPNGLVSKTETDYDTALAYHGPLDGITWNAGCSTGTVGGTKTYSPSDAPATGTCTYTAQQTNPVTNYTGSYGKVIATREFDWGQGTPGPLLRQTSMQYQWQINGNYLSNNFLDLVSSMTTRDGAGNQVAQTTYGYDEYALGSSGITTQLNTSPANGSFRGNQTSAHHWLNGSTVSTPNCSISVSNGSVVSYAQYNDSGTVASITDACGTSAGDSHHTTTHIYGSAFAGAYPTQTCNPLGQCVSGAYDFNTGLLTSFTDANNQTTTYSYDNRWRMTQALFPVADSSGVHPETDFDFPNVTTVHRKRKQTATPSTIWIEDYAYFDGVGRTKQTRLVDQEGDDYVDTTYDALGRVSTVSNPHRSTSSSTDGITTTYYDALSRVVQVAGQDGTVLPAGAAVTQCQANNTCTDYSNFPTVTVTDQAGNGRRSRTDALGRLVEVDEPSPGGTQPGSPGQGNINISGSLYSSTNPGNAATGSVTVSGAAQWMYVWICNDTCIKQKKTDPGGTVTITVNGHQDQVLYNGGSTASSIASALIGQINGDSGAFVWASGPSCADSTDCTIGLQARTPGPNYSLSAQGLSNDEADGFTSFDGTYSSGGSLTNGVYPVTTYDSGTVTVTVAGYQASASYNQNQNNTAAALTQALISSLNATGSPVTASPSGSTGIQLTATSVGTGTNYTVQGGSTASFTASSTTLAGGINPSGLDAPFVTLYSYNTLGDLRQVNQLGDGSQSRVRTFTYDSLSRLLTANNPESGQISYSYDADGNLAQKNSPAPNVISPSTGTQTISYCYDVLNRILGKGYGSQACPLTSPAVGYTYDQGGAAANAIGHLTLVADQAGSATYTYDALGRTATESRTTAGITKGMSYAYNVESSLQSVTYPSGAVVGYQYTNAGRVGLAQDQAHSINYVTGAGGPSTLVTHFPDGSLSAYVNGYTGSFAGISNSFTYNQRLQPINMSASSPAGSVFSLNYDFHAGAANNGNVYGITNNKDNTRNQTFAYDSLNRLISAHNAGTNCAAMTLNGKTEYWGNSYSYDPFGNLTDKTKLQNYCGGEDIHFTVNSQNQIHPKAGADYVYDIAGNMTTDLADSITATYDPENRIQTASASGVTTSYTYDADGNRVEKTNSSTTTLYWYMSPGIVAESDQNGNLKSEYVFFNGERIARRDNPTGPSSSVVYYFSDHLKTTDIVTNAQGTILNESDYYPWGGELQFSNADSNHYKFTGKERDTETGLDYFGARYYSNGLGRFISADKPFADQHPEDPQSWNLYNYTRNNPLKFVDDTGEGTRPAQSPAINRALESDPTLKNVILKSVNFSPGAFEDAYKSGRLSDLNSGAGSTLRGLAGEATVISDINGASSIEAGAAFSSPTNLPGVSPDIQVVYNGIAPVTLFNVASGQGGITDVQAGPLKTSYLEVKSGLSTSSVGEGVQQAVDTSAAISKAGLSGAASVLVVDAGVWSSLSDKTRAQYVSQARDGGAYIQVVPGLADAARQRAQQLVDQARKEDQKK